MRERERERGQCMKRGIEECTCFDEIPWATKRQNDNNSNSAIQNRTRNFCFLFFVSSFVCFCDAILDHSNALTNRLRELVNAAIWRLLCDWTGHTCVSFPSQFIQRKHIFFHNLMLLFFNFFFLHLITNAMQCDEWIAVATAATFLNIFVWAKYPCVYFKTKREMKRIEIHRIASRQSQFSCENVCGADMDAMLR